MSGDSLGCHNLGKGCYWHLMSRDRAAIKHPACGATNKESSTPIYQNVKSAAIWEEEVCTVLFPGYVGFFFGEPNQVCFSFSQLLMAQVPKMHAYDLSLPRMDVFVSMQGVAPWRLTCWYKCWHCASSPR